MNTSTEQLQAWNDPANWSHRGMLGLYFSKQDRRVWVSKPNARFGWTLNLARPAGAALFLCALLLPTTILVVTAVAVGLS
jgi:uncharacterized membrane protein